MTEITCPVCSNTGEPVARIGPLAVCFNCGSSLVVEQNGSIRRAIATDTESLQPGDRAKLVKARSSIARPGRPH